MGSKLRYPHIRPFDREDAQIFFGRDKDIEQMLTHLREKKVLTIHGASGTGKSSLIEAGIVPRIGQAYGLSMPPREENIKKIRFSYFNKQHPQSPIEIFRQFLKIQPSALDELIFVGNSLWLDTKKYLLSHGHEADSKLIFILDQFEELFSYPETLVQDFAAQLTELYLGHRPENIRKAIERTLFLRPEFEQNLTPSLRDFLEQPLQVKIITALRSDRLHFLDKLRPQLPNILLETFELDALDRDEATMAIVGPAHLKEDAFAIEQPFEWNQESIDKILDYLTQQNRKKIEAAELQIICHHIEDDLLTGKINSPVTAESLPESLDAILKGFYDNALKELSNQDRWAAQQLIEDALIEQDEKRRISLDESIVEKRVGEALLEHLTERRILNKVPNSTGSFNYEVSHDTLVEPILQAREERMAAQRALEKIEEKKRQEEAKKTADLDVAEKHCNNGYSLLSTGRYDYAIKSFEHALSIIEQYAEEYERNVDICLILSELSLKTGDAKMSEISLGRAEDQSKQHKSPQILAKIREIRGLQSKTQDEAFSNYQEAKSQYLLTGSTQQAARIAEHMARLLEKESGLVHEPLVKSLEFFEEAARYYDLSLSQIERQRIYLDIQRVKTALSEGRKDTTWGYLKNLFTNEVYLLKGKDSIYVGRSTVDIKNDINLPISYISRRHIVINSNLTVEDLRSLNGTSVNGKVLPYGTSASFRDGDILTLANVFPLQFSINQPKISPIPKDVWGILLDATNRKFQHLSATAYALESVKKTFENGSMSAAEHYEIKISESAGEQSNLRIRKGEGFPEIFVAANAPWDVVFTLKENDYDYKDYIFPKDTWQKLEHYTLPLLFTKINHKDNTILEIGPSFQILLASKE